MLHKTFLFDYNSFINKTKELVPDIEQGDYYYLITEAKEVFANVNTEEWILHDLGTTLDSLTIDEINYPSDIGYLLLVILSKYLSVVPSLDSDWRLLNRALKLLNWNDDDLQMLFCGNSTAYLVKPDILVSPEENLEMNSPYYLWVKPTQSFHTGWLNLEQIIHWKLRLLITGPKIASLNKANLNNLADYESFRSINITDRLKKAYGKVLSMINTAIENEKGLFMVVS